MMTTKDAAGLMAVDDLLRRVEAAKTASDTAHQHLLDAVAQALDAGVPATVVARASGINRTTLWRWEQRSSR